MYVPDIWPKYYTVTNFECTIQEYTANDIHAYNLLPERKQEIKKLG